MRYLGSFPEEKDELNELLYCKFNEDGRVKDVIEEKDLKIEENEIFNEKKKIQNFKVIISDGDYFGKIYGKFIKIKNKLDKLEGTINDNLEKEENIEEIDKILNKFNKKIFIIISKKIFLENICINLIIKFCDI